MLVIVALYALPIVVMGYMLYKEVERHRYAVRKQIKDMHFKKSLHSLSVLQNPHSSTNSIKNMDSLHSLEELESLTLQNMQNVDSKSPAPKSA